MPAKEISFPKKAKTTLYITNEEETKLNELFIKRFKKKGKTDKSTLLYEGINLFFEKEIWAANG